jgi:hypothetical protein
MISAQELELIRKNHAKNFYTRKNKKIGLLRMKLVELSIL